MIRQMTLVLGLTIASPATAAPFDGTWKADVNFTQVNTRPKIESISNGVYRCATCLRPFSIPADGKPHAVPAEETGTVETVKVVDAHTVVIKLMKGDRIIPTHRLMALPDGKSLRVTSKELAANGKVVMVEDLRRRVAAGPKGSHAISGTWQDAKTERIDEAVLTMTMNETNGVLHFRAATGESYDALIGGPAVPIKGDTAGTLAAVRRAAPRTLVETDTLNGKIISVMTMVIDNPTTMTVTLEDRQRGGVSRFVARRR